MVQDLVTLTLQSNSGRKIHSPQRHEYQNSAENWPTARRKEWTAQQDWLAPPVAGVPGGDRGLDCPGLGQGRDTASPCGQPLGGLCGCCRLAAAAGQIELPGDILGPCDSVEVAS
jgi:hypothetical protein